ncbi:MAG TPA: hypothetical protein VFT04_04220 [Gemmatimonadales bacterium]|nr:hypothetical protein [Gemmatimonadales bacterium]
MSRRVAFCGAAALVALSALASPTAGSAQAPSRASSASDSVRIGCSGGSTGLGLGNTITRDGQLATYTKPLREAAAHTPLRRDSAAAKAVFGALDRIHFRAFRFSEIGNMTCHLELIDDEGKHEVNWVMGQAPPELAPALTALRRAFGDDRRMWP